MSLTYLGLGSNRGDREKNLIRAVALIGKECKLIDYSSIYITSPVGYTDQSFFLNMVIKVDSNKFTSLELLNFVKHIEKKMGRKQTFRWGPRLIDIDILYIEGVEIDTDVLSIPHKELLNRNFALIPLAEVTESLMIKGKIMVLKNQIEKLLESQRNPADYLCSPKETGEEVTLIKSKESLELNGLYQVEC